MDHPGAGIGAGGQPAAGEAVVVPVDVEAAAPAAAPPAVSVWTRVTTHVTSGGAAPPVARLAWTRLSARLALAAALFLLGCAAAGLALFAMLLPPADSRLLGKTCAPPIDAEVASLRTASGCLLLAASAQVLAATMALLVPARIVAALGNLLGLLTAFRTMDVLEKLVPSCHGSAHGDLAFHFGVLIIVAGPAFVVCAFVVSLR